VPASGCWPALTGLLATHSAGPPRTRSLILTVYGDALTPRGGEAALTALLTLMRRIGLTDGVVRTALSRLTAEGWLDRTRTGRTSFYRLAPRGVHEFAAATPRIYGPLSQPWNGQLRIVFTDTANNRASLEQSGYALVAPSVLVAPEYAEAPTDAICLSATGEPEAVQSLARRAWPLAALAHSYSRLLGMFTPLAAEATALPPLEALVTRVLLIHEYRRIALRDPHLPAALLPKHWPGFTARHLCISIYAALAPASERWLDGVENASGPLPRGPDPLLRFGAASD
jgi:phenylacetic acid degradation operon negative regulatory protein